MKHRFVLPQLVVALLILAGMSSGRATTYSFTGTTAGGGSYSWSTGTGWNSTPVSGTATTLSFFQGVGFTAGTSGSYTLNNDIAGTFQLNRLNLVGSGNSGAGTTTVNITGTTLSFVSNSGTSPVIYLAAQNFAGGQLNYNVANDLEFVDDTTVTQDPGANANPTYQLSGRISGGGDLTMSATGRTLSISGTTNNTRLYGGDIRVNAGTLTFNPAAGSNYQFYTTGNLELNGGILSLQGSNVTLSVLSFSGLGGSITGVNTGHTIVVNDADTAAKSFSGTVQRDTIIHYLGAGKLTMPAVNAGGLSAGPWRVGGTGTLSTPGISDGRGPERILAQGTFEVTGTSGNVLGNSVSDLTFYGGALRFAPVGSGANVAVNAQVGTSRYFLNSHSAIELDKGNNNSLSVTLGQNSTASVINRGAPGTLIIKPASGLANLGTASGETLRVLGANSSAPPAVTNGIVAPWIVGQDTNGKGDFLTYSGSGAVTDTGFIVANYSATNSFTGASASSVIKITSAQTISADVSVYGLRNDSTITINAGRSLSLETSLAGLILNGGTIGGAGTFRTGVNNTHTRTYSIYTGIEGGVISSNMEIRSQGATGFSDISGNVALTKFGEGTLVLSGSVTNTGGATPGTVTGQTVINEGAIRFNANMSNLIGSATNATIVLNGGVLETSGTFNRALTTTGNATGGVNLGVNANSPGGGFSAFGNALSVNLGGSGATLTWSATNFVKDYGQLILGSITADSVVDWQNGLELGTNSSVYFRQIDVKDNVNSSGDLALISGLIADTSGSEGLHGIQKVGQGTLVLTANNTYTGITAISSGTLQLGYVGTVNSQSYDGTTGSVAGDVHNYGTLAFNRSNAYSHGGTISGSGNVVHAGTGTTTLTTANSYSGGTVVNAGTLLINNTAGSGAGSGGITVNNGGTLGGTGSFTGAVTVNDGGSLLPGASIGTLGSGTLTMTNGSTFGYEVDSGVALSVGADLQKVTGDLILSGTVALTLGDIDITPSVFAENTVFSLINYTGDWNGGFFTYGGNTITNGGIFTAGLNTWQLNYDAVAGGSNFSSEFAGPGSHFVNITAIPEPNTLWMLVAGAAVLIFLRRRKLQV